MSIIKTDTLSGLHTVVKPSQALKEAMHDASIGWESRAEKVEAENSKLVKIVGNLLDILAIEILSDDYIVRILDCSSLTAGKAQEG